MSENDLTKTPSPPPPQPLIPVWDLPSFRNGGPVAKKDTVPLPNDDDFQLIPHGPSDPFLRFLGLNAITSLVPRSHLKQTSPEELSRISEICRMMFAMFKLCPLGESQITVLITAIVYVQLFYSQVSLSDKTFDMHDVCVSALFFAAKVGTQAFQFIRQWAFVRWRLTCADMTIAMPTEKELFAIIDNIRLYETKLGGMSGFMFEFIVPVEFINPNYYMSTQLAAIENRLASTLYDAESASLITKIGEDEIYLEQLLEHLGVKSQEEHRDNELYAITNNPTEWFIRQVIFRNVWHILNHGHAASTAIYYHPIPQFFAAYVRARKELNETVAPLPNGWMDEFESGFDQKEIDEIHALWDSVPGYEAGVSTPATFPPHLQSPDALRRAMAAVRDRKVTSAIPEDKHLPVGHPGRLDSRISHSRQRMDPASLKSLDPALVAEASHSRGSVTPRAHETSPSTSSDGTAYQLRVTGLPPSITKEAVHDALKTAYERSNRNRRDRNGENDPFQASIDIRQENGNRERWAIASLSRYQLHRITPSNSITVMGQTYPMVRHRASLSPEIQHDPRNGASRHARSVSLRRAREEERRDKSRSLVRSAIDELMPADSRDQHKIHVKFAKAPQMVTEQDLREFFSQFGNITGVNIPRAIFDNRTRMSTKPTYGFVRFRNKKACEAALKNPRPREGWLVNRAISKLKRDRADSEFPVGRRDREPRHDRTRFTDRTRSENPRDRKRHRPHDGGPPPLSDGPAPPFGRGPLGGGSTHGAGGDIFDDLLMDEGQSSNSMGPPQSRSRGRSSGRGLAASSERAADGATSSGVDEKKESFFGVSVEFTDLPFTWDTSKVLKAFASHGNIASFRLHKNGSVKVVEVNFRTEEDQQRFLEKQFELGGVAGRVKRAAGSTVNHHFPVLVRSLKANAIASHVERTFSTCGPIVATTTVDKGKPTFHALVLFKDKTGAENALSRRMTVGTDQVMVNRLHYDRYLKGGPRRSRSTARSKSSANNAYVRDSSRSSSTAPTSSTSSSTLPKAKTPQFGVLVENVATTVDNQRLRELFVRNHVRRCEILLDSKGVSTSRARLEFGTEADRDHTLSTQQNLPLDGKTLRLSAMEDTASDRADDSNNSRSRKRARRPSPDPVSDSDDDESLSKRAKKEPGVGIEQAEASASDDSDKEDGEIEEGELPEEGGGGDADADTKMGDDSVKVETNSVSLSSNKRKRDHDASVVKPEHDHHSRKKKHKSSSSLSQSRTREERHKMAGKAFQKNGATYRYVEPLVGRELRSVPETMYKSVEERGLKPRDLFRVRVRPKPQYVSDEVDLRGELLKFCTSDELERWNFELVAGHQVNHGLMAFQTIEEEEGCLRRFYGNDSKPGDVPPWLALKIALECPMSRQERSDLDKSAAVKNPKPAIKIRLGNLTSIDAWGGRHPNASDVIEWLKGSQIYCFGEVVNVMVTRVNEGEVFVQYMTMQQAMQAIGSVKGRPVNGQVPNLVQQSSRLPLMGKQLGEYLASRETRYRAPLERLGLRLDEAGLPQPIHVEPEPVQQPPHSAAQQQQQRPKSSIFAVPSFSNYSAATGSLGAVASGRVQAKPATAPAVSATPFGMPVGPATHLDLHRNDSSQEEESKMNDQNEATLSDNASHILRPRGYVRAHQAQLATVRGRGKRGRGRGRGGITARGGFQNLQGVVAQANLHQQVPNQAAHMNPYQRVPHAIPQQRMLGIPSAIPGAHAQYRPPSAIPTARVPTPTSIGMAPPPPPPPPPPAPRALGAAAVAKSQISRVVAPLVNGTYAMPQSRVPVGTPQAIGNISMYPTLPLPVTPTAPATQQQKPAQYAFQMNAAAYGRPARVVMPQQAMPTLMAASLHHRHPHRNKPSTLCASTLNLTSPVSTSLPSECNDHLTTHDVPTPTPKTQVSTTAAPAPHPPASTITPAHPHVPVSTHPNAHLIALAARDPNFVRAYQYYQRQFALQRQLAANMRAATHLTVPTLSPSATATRKPPAVSPPASHSTGSSTHAPLKKPQDDPK